MPVINLELGELAASSFHPCEWCLCNIWSCWLGSPAVISSAWGHREQSVSAPVHPTAVACRLVFPGLSNCVPEPRQSRTGSTARVADANFKVTAIKYSVDSLMHKKNSNNAQTNSLKSETNWFLQLCYGPVWTFCQVTNVEDWPSLRVTGTTFCQLHNNECSYMGSNLRQGVRASQTGLWK